MNSESKKRFFSLFLTALLCLCAQSSMAQNKEWREISPAELAAKTPSVEPDADAEALFWEVRVDDSSYDELALNHYVRVKIFTERGREKFSKVDIPFFRKMKIKDVAARIIKSDGSIVEIKKEDVFEREIVKANGLKIKAKSFAVPNIEPGVILEYRYREIVNNAGAGNMDLRFQRDIPIREISYYVKPYAYGSSMSYTPFNMGDTKFVEDTKGFYVARMKNVPALIEEPQMPPEDEVRSWALIFYRSDLTNWIAIANIVGKNFKDSIKPNADIKKLAQEVTAGAVSDEEKLSKLFNYTKTQIKNINYEPTASEEVRIAVSKMNKKAADVLKNKQGGTSDIDMLFASMATSLGYDARLLLSGDRSELFFRRKNQNLRFVHPCCVAVKVGEKWKFYNPGSYFTTEGMLSWNEEGTGAMVTGENEFYWVNTPLSTEEKTIAKRTGKFKLGEDGTLEGTVKIEYSGHLAQRYKANNFDQSANKREENLLSEIKSRLSAAEVSVIGIENVSDAEKPFIYNYKIKIPNYAQKTGKRLFLQPGFFEYGKSPVFSAATRKHQIYFSYPWSEIDDISIQLPKNFGLDNADRPETVADPQKIGSLVIDIGYDKESNLIIYKRKFHFGGGGSILFPVTAYPTIKNMFDAFHKANSHIITLKQM